MQIRGPKNWKKVSFWGLSPKSPIQKSCDTSSHLSNGHWKPPALAICPGHFFLLDLGSREVWDIWLLQNDLELYYLVLFQKISLHQQLCKSLKIQIWKYQNFLFPQKFKAKSEVAKFSGEMKRKSILLKYYCKFQNYSEIFRKIDSLSFEVTRNAHKLNFLTTTLTTFNFVRNPMKIL